MALTRSRPHEYGHQRNWPNYADDAEKRIAVRPANQERKASAEKQSVQPERRYVVENAVP